MESVPEKLQCFISSWTGQRESPSSWKLWKPFPKSFNASLIVEQDKENHAPARTYGSRSRNASLVAEQDKENHAPAFPLVAIPEKFQYFINCWTGQRESCSSWNLWKPFPKSFNASLIVEQDKENHAPARTYGSRSRNASLVAEQDKENHAPAGNYGIRSRKASMFH